MPAAHHGRSRVFDPGVPATKILDEAEGFATGDYAAFLVRGASMPAEDRNRVITRFADLTGLDPVLAGRADVFSGAEPSLATLRPAFTVAVNHLLRSEIRVRTRHE